MEKYKDSDVELMSILLKLQEQTSPMTIGVPRDDIEDDKYGVYTPLFSNMGEAAALQPDELVFGAMMSGFNEKCYDGLSFFNTAHKVGDATYSNRSNKKLSRESYMEGRSSIMSIKGDKGKSLKLVPDLLVVPPALEETARLILEADQIDGTTNVLKGTAKLHVEPALAEHPEYWFLLCTNRFLKPFIYQLRKKIKFTSLTTTTKETYTSERWGKEGGTTIHQISFTVDISKIKDLPLLYKLIDELKDAQNRTDSPTPATT